MKILIPNLQVVCPIIISSDAGLISVKMSFMKSRTTTTWCIVTKGISDFVD